MNQRGVIHLLLPLILVLIVAVAAFVLISTGVIKITSLPSSVQKITGKDEPEVALKNEYINPFDKSAQYVNPFDSYKNPFDAIE